MDELRTQLNEYLKRHELTIGELLTDLVTNVEIIRDVDESEWHVQNALNDIIDIGNHLRAAAKAINAPE